MGRDIFHFKKYKDYLNERLDERPRGERARLAHSIGCQTAYVAQVLRGAANFNMEQGEAINEFFSHAPEEATFFLLLLQIERAGTPSLRRRIQSYIDEIHERRKQLRNRLTELKTVLDLEAQAQYYSSWHYAAIHALVSVPGFQSPEIIAQRLRISPKKAAQAIDFLLSIKILSQNKKTNKIEIGTARIHLGINSPFIYKHHLNWRLQAMNVLENGARENLHYSSAVSLSHADVEKIHEILLRAIKDAKELIKESKEQVTMGFCIDFFEF